MKTTAEKEKPIRKKEARRGAGRVNAQLARRIEERTAEVRALRAEMDTFVNSISHDFRAPLMHISGFVDLLAQHPGAKLDEQSREYLQTIASATARLERMIEDLAALARIRRAEMNYLPVDLASLVRTVVHGLDATKGHRRITWQIDPLPMVQADPTLLREAIAHLAANAFKFTRPREEACIQIGAKRGRRETIVFVRDNGVGFDMNQREKLFGLFQRLHAYSEFPGSGLGLAGVRRIIQRHGGRTWGEGEPGEGATFYFSLPDHGTGSA